MTKQEIKKLGLTDRFLISWLSDVLLGLAAIIVFIILLVI